MLCLYVAVVAEMEQGPIVAVAAEDDMSATSAVAAIRSAFRKVLGPMHMCGTSSATSGAAINLYVVNEIRICH